MDEVNEVDEVYGTLAEVDVVALAEVDGRAIEEKEDAAF